ncbi:MAG: hypothetical protein JWM20_669 [Patescibacteria group bacterium]|nr:hypothetical protein [Patescibacteria group bacterium]
MTKPITELINLINEPNRSRCSQLLADYSERFALAPGSKTKHQAWPGGYLDHVAEIMNLAKILYETTSSIRQLPFSLGSAILVLFLHDLEKPFKYVEPTMHFQDDTAKENFISDMIARYSIKLSDDEQNALKYIHGEGHDYNSNTRVQGPLAAFVHICDTWSARIWFDFPKK